MRGGIAERGGVRVGHRIIEINGQSVVATAHEKIVQALSNSVGEVRPCLSLCWSQNLSPRPSGPYISMTDICAPSGVCEVLRKATGSRPPGILAFLGEPSLLESWSVSVLVMCFHLDLRDPPPL